MIFCLDNWVHFKGTKRSAWRVENGQNQGDGSPFIAWETSLSSTTSWWLLFPISVKDTQLHCKRSSRFAPEFPGESHSHQT